MNLVINLCPSKRGRSTRIGIRNVLVYLLSTGFLVLGPFGCAGPNNYVEGLRKQWSVAG